MKWKNYFIASALILTGVMISSCGEESQPVKKDLPKLNVWPVAAPGTEVAHYSKAIEEDKLNNGKFEVTIRPNDSTKNNGSFDIKIKASAFDEDLVKTFPKWYEDNIVQPLIKPMDTMKYGVVIGFDPGDGTFNDIYIVTYDKGELKFAQTKMYYQPAK